MPLSASGLSAAIKSQLDADFTVSSYSGASAARQNFCDRLAAGIVTYLVANNVVTVETDAGTGTGSFV